MNDGRLNEQLSDDSTDTSGWKRRSRRQGVRRRIVDAILATWTALVGAERRDDRVGCLKVR